MASAVFFLRRQRFLYRSQAADLLIDLHQFFSQPLIIPKLGDLPLRLTYGRRSGQGLSHRLAMPFVGQPQVRSMTGIFRTRTVTARFATAKHRSDDGSGTHIFEIRQSAEQIRPAGFQLREGLGHGASFWK
jgi:hypothetical protein